MTRKYFGTDGIRGRANTYPMTPDIALKVGMAAGLEFSRGDHRHKVVIAKDTRLSGYMIEAALVSGFTSVGMDVIQVGPLPTPAVALLTRSMRADFGVMISASHNSFEDNGIKLFAPDGQKLSDATEKAIEVNMDKDLTPYLAKPQDLGRAKRIDDARGRYIEFAKSTFPKTQRLDGLKIVMDCANGAAYDIAPTVLWELGAEVIPIADKPNGFNINDNCGSTYPQTICEHVIAEGADIGIALDGDADRVVVCDEKGQLLDGDNILAIIANSWKKNGMLRGNTIAATQMSNLGLERFLTESDIKLIRTGVGDRYVLEAMREHNLNIGGEQSGHIILRDYITTGDGLIAALQVLSAMVESTQPLSKCGRLFEQVPQTLQNVVYERGCKTNPLDLAIIKDAIADIEQKLGNSGRIFVRKSGTEPKIRVMIEGENQNEIESLASDLCELIKNNCEQSAS